MEDAMVLNKCAMERGLAHGQIYKTEIVDLSLLEGYSGKKMHMNEVSSYNSLSILSISLVAHLSFYISDSNIVMEWNEVFVATVNTHT